MASRTLTVALRALVQGYTGPMRQAAAATGPLEASLMRVQRAGDGISRVGDSLTRRLTVPLVAVGAVATHMAAEFDKSFTTMQTLAGVTADEVAGLKDKVLDLAGETGRAPQELAEALYFLQSSGLDSAQAMDALEVSAKGSAARLGDTAVIADTVSSAMLGYAQSGLTAAEATDVLVATARAGKAEPAELAAQMGRLVPVASELGISFDQVGGAIAALSTKGFNAEQATTALTNVMSKLLKPSIQAEQALEGVGLSTDSLRSMIAEKGIIGTLEELRDRLGDNGFVRFLEDQQAVQGGLALLGGDLDATKAIMDEVANSAGATENAFATWADSMGAQNAQAFGKFQSAMIRLGDAIAPLAADIAELLGGIASGFADLSPWQQKAIVGIAAFAAAIGPLLSAGGRLITMFSTTLKLMTSFAVPTGQVAGAFNRTGAAASSLRVGMAGLATVIVAAAVAIDQYNRAEQRSNTERLTKEFLAAGDSAEAMDEVLRSAAKHGATELIGVFGELAATNREAAERFYDQAEAAGASESALTQMRDILDTTAAAEAQTADDTAALTGEMDEQAGSTNEAIEALKAYGDTLRAQFDPLFGFMDALGANREAQQGVTDAQNALNDAVARYGAGSPEATAAQQALTEAQRQATGSALDVTAATAQLNAAIAANPGLLASSKAQLGTWVAQGLITQATADAMAAQFDQTALRAVALGQTDPNVQVSATDSATPVLVGIIGQLRQVQSKTITITVARQEAEFQSLRRAGGGLVPRYLARGGVGGPRGTDTIPAWLTPGEMVLNKGQQTNLFHALGGGSSMARPMTSARAFGGAGGGGRVDVGLRISGSGGLAQMVQKGVRTGEIQLSVAGKRVTANR